MLQHTIPILNAARRRGRQIVKLVNILFEARALYKFVDTLEGLDTGCIVFTETPNINIRLDYDDNSRKILYVFLLDRDSFIGGDFVMTTMPPKHHIVISNIDKKMQIISAFDYLTDVITDYNMDCGILSQEEETEITDIYYNMLYQLNILELYKKMTEDPNMHPLDRLFSETKDKLNSLKELISDLIQNRVELEKYKPYKVDNYSDDKEMTKYLKIYNFLIGDKS